MPCIVAADLESSLGLQVLIIDFADTFCLREEIVLEYIKFDFHKPKHVCLLFFYFGLKDFFLFVIEVLHD